MILLGIGLGIALLLIPLGFPLRTALGLIRTWLRLFGFSAGSVPFDDTAIFAVRRLRVNAPSVVLIHGIGTSLEQWA